MDTDANGTIAELRYRMAGLERQVDQVKSAILAAAGWVSATLIVVGLLLPYVRLDLGEGSDHELHTVNIFGLIGSAFGSKTDDGGADPVAVLFGIAFTGLVVFTLLGLLVLRLVGSRQGTPGQATFARVVVIVLLIGCAGAWFTLLLAIGNSDSGFYPAVLVLTLGVAGAAAVVLPGKARAWWVGGPRPEQPQPFNLFDRSSQAEPQ